jgi:mgtE-like transporter
MKIFYKILKESIPILSVCIIGGLFAGLILHNLEKEFSAIPGLLILLPGILALRGNISSALGSRLSSALHLGTVEAGFDRKLFRNPIIVQNIWASLALNLLMSFVLGIAAYYISILFGIQNVSIIMLTTISVIVGLLSGIVLTLLTILLAMYSTLHGYDPDNVLTPAVATIGDALTVMFLFLSVKLIF